MSVRPTTIMATAKWMRPDYVVWPKNPAAHGGDPAGYGTWQVNFGGTFTPASGGALGVVPETASATLLILAAYCVTDWQMRAI
jgi:hypothetical protein